MIRLNGWRVPDNGEINKRWVMTLEYGINYITFQFGGEQDFITLKKLCKSINNVSNAACKVLNLPFFPFAYDEHSPISFNYYVQMINKLRFREVHTVEASSTPLEYTLLRIRNEDISVRSAIQQIKSSLKTRNSERDINITFDKAKQAGIYVLFVSHFEKYREQMKYDNILCDIGCGEDDCRTIILIDDVLKDLPKYEMIVEQLKLNNPNLESIIVCTAHCTNDIYGSDLIKEKKIQKLITTNSVLVYKDDINLSYQEQEIIEVLDAFNGFRNLSLEGRMPSMKW